jgi:hypothetical protein
MVYPSDAINSEGDASANLDNKPNIPEAVSPLPTALK